MGVGAGLYMCDVVKKVHVRYLISWWVLVNLKYSVLVFRFRYSHITAMQEYPSMWKHQDGVGKLWQEVSVKVYWPTTPSMKEFLMESPSYLAWSVCLSICRSSEPFNNGSTDQDADGWGLGWAQGIMYCYGRFQYSHITTTQEYTSVWKHQDRIDILRWKVSVEVYRLTTPSVKEFFIFSSHLVRSTPSHSSHCRCVTIGKNLKMHHSGCEAYLLLA